MKFSNSSQISSYTGLRRDVLALVECPVIRVLDVGCSSGKLIKYLKNNLNAEYAVGIECNPGFARQAACFADKVLIGDLDMFEWDKLEKEAFDLIVLADVLEHTKNPSFVLSEILKSATPEAQIIISLPNIQHWTAIKNLFIGRWPQRERGLFDKTHLRFFTKASIIELATTAGLDIEFISCNFRLIDDPKARINMFARFLAFGPFIPFFTYQYVVRMRRQD